MKIDELFAMVKSKREVEEQKVYNRMTLEQLQELACGSPDDARIRKILVSVDGLWLLED